MIRKNDIPKSINFMEPVTRPTDIWANAYEWMFAVGKYLLIVVEVVALGAFISRFIIDERNNDLTRDINDQVAILSSGEWKQNSITYENIQNLMGDVKTISQGQKFNSTVIEQLRNSIPSGLEVQRFSFSDGRVSLALETTDFKAFKDYESAIKNNPSYQEVSVNTTKHDSTYEIRISFAVTDIDG